jgi:hypothetical protein
MKLYEKKPGHLTGLFNNLTERGSVLAHHPHFLAQTALGFLLLALTLDARLFVKLALLHFTKQPFLLQLPLKHPDGFLDVIVDNMDFH